MNLPTYEELYPYTLQSLSNGVPKTVKKIREEVAKNLELSPEQRNFRLASGTIQYNNRIAWSLSYLKQAGAVVSPSRGTYRITELGTNLLKTDIIDDKKLLQFESFRKFKNRTHKEKEVEDVNSNAETPEEAIISKIDLIDIELREDILGKILENSPFYFEKIVLKLLNKMGYGEGNLLTSKSNDGGIDGIINEDPLGFHSIYVQAKRWSPNRTVGRPEIQKFKGAMDARYEGLNQGVFITTAKFSNEAKEYVNQLKLAKIKLIDGESLAKEMIRHKVGVTVKQVVEIHAIDLDFYAEDD